jgi:4-amino-4-deoxy-L-arabinose transferase-like glycosyltransferase
MSELASPNRNTLIALALLLAAVWLGTLDMRKLVRPDEGRYAEIPREMVATGDWLTPRLNAIKYFEKPPLQYWATATAYTVFGEHHWTARLWPALSGLLCVLLIYFAGRRLFGEVTGFYAALILASSPGFIIVAQINTLDMGLTLFMTATLLCFLLGLTDTTRKNSPWILAAWASAALAVLSKGLIGFVLPAGVIGAYVLLHRDWRLLTRLRWGWGLLVFFAIAAPWFVLVQRANPEFFDFFFIHEHFSRFTSKVHRRQGGWWYFLPVLVFGLLPWIMHMPRALWRGWQDQPPSGTFRPLRFLALWSVLIFMFFSVSGSKLPSYILPVFPALALLIAHGLRAVKLKTLFWNAIVLAVAATALIAYAPYVTGWANEKVSAVLFARYTPWLFAAGVAGCIGYAAAGWASQRGMRHTAVIGIALGTLGLAQFAALGHNVLAPAYSAHDIAYHIKPHLEPGIPFYSVHNYEQTLPFYIKRPVTLVEYSDEMAYGLEQEPHLGLRDVPSFVKAWNGHNRALAIIEPVTYAKLKKEGLPMQLIAINIRYAVVKKPDGAGTTRTAP